MENGKRRAGIGGNCLLVVFLGMGKEDVGIDFYGYLLVFSFPIGSLRRKLSSFGISC